MRYCEKMGDFLRWERAVTDQEWEMRSGIVMRELVRCDRIELSLLLLVCPPFRLAPEAVL